MPDPDADRSIRSLRQEGWIISHKLCKDLPQILQEGNPLHARHLQIAAAVRAMFGDDITGDENGSHGRG